MPVSEVQGVAEDDDEFWSKMEAASSGQRSGGTPSSQVPRGRVEQNRGLTPASTLELQMRGLQLHTLSITMCASRCAIQRTVFAD